MRNFSAIAMGLSLISLATLHAATSVEEVSSSEANPVTVQAVWSRTPVVLDGKLDDPVWKSAPKYPLALSVKTQELRPGLQDPGTVQFAWDDEFFYAAFDFQDGDIVQEADKDQKHHYQTGDVAELFLKPKEETWYWEMYATPNALKTAFFFPGRGRLGLPSGFKHHSDLQTAATVEGTLDAWTDHDTRWVAEMAIPRRELAKAGIPLDPSHPWRIFVGRYNYSRYLPFKELSMMPPQVEDSYHLYEGWADLELVKPASK
jgi:hypothetical protein